MTSGDKQLLKVAEEAASNAYAPYSNLYVGAAVRSRDGRVFTGVNVENASYGATVCAERNAIYQAITAGCHDLLEIAIDAGPGNPAWPCGACRQVMHEFNPHMRVILRGPGDKPKVYILSELLPHPFEMKP